MMVPTQVIACRAPWAEGASGANIAIAFMSVAALTAVVGWVWFFCILPIPDAFDGPGKVCVLLTLACPVAGGVASINLLAKRGPVWLNILAVIVSVVSICSFVCELGYLLCICIFGHFPNC
jgi:hypothetical protein